MFIVAIEGKRYYADSAMFIVAIEGKQRLETTFVGI
jgi:hypothetical protein